MTEFLTDPEAMVDAVLARVGKTVGLGLPIGLGKPAHIANAFYRRAAADRSIRLRIITGLSIARPKASSDIEARFMNPIVERLFGDFPEPDYIGPYARNELPPNIEVVEFFMQAGGFIGNPAAQQHYISTNYSMVARDLLLQGLNVYAQAVGKRGEGAGMQLSLSSNSDSLTLFELLERPGPDTPSVVVLGQVNRALPFMPRDAALSPSRFDFVLDDPALDHDLFAAPGPPVASADHMIGLRASALVRDGGTIQIGIGSLGDAIAAACILRHKDGPTYEAALEATGAAADAAGLIAEIGGTGPFEQGLYGATEMFADCYRALYQNDVLTREVFDDPTIQRLANDHGLKGGDTGRAFDLLAETGALGAPLRAEDLDFLVRTGVFRPGLGLEGGEVVLPDGGRLSADIADETARAALRAACLGPRLRNGTVLHGGFFLGPHAMYDMLKTLPEEELEKFCMTGIGHVNQLQGNEPMASLQRRHARFVNTAMMVTLMGAACSDGLENGQVISGVGGQFDFVAMAQVLEGARSILTLRSTRTKRGKVTSNIVWNYGHITIPRHLRDIVVTEYGVADLLGRQDHEVISRLIEIADSRFQEELRQKAVEAGKLPADYEIPEARRQNLPERLEEMLAPFRKRGLFGQFPLGTDLTHEELVLANVLKGLKGRMGRFGGAAGMLAEAVIAGGEAPPAAAPYLARMGLEKPANLRETMLRRMIVAALADGGHI